MWRQDSWCHIKAFTCPITTCWMLVDAHIEKIASNLDSFIIPCKCRHVGRRWGEKCKKLDISYETADGVEMSGQRRREECRQRVYGAQMWLKRKKEGSYRLPTLVNLSLPRYCPVLSFTISFLKIPSKDLDTRVFQYLTFIHPRGVKAGLDIHFDE